MRIIRRYICSNVFPTHRYPVPSRYRHFWMMVLKCSLLWWKKLPNSKDFFRVLRFFCILAFSTLFLYILIVSNDCQLSNWINVSRFHVRISNLASFDSKFDEETKYDICLTSLIILLAETAFLVEAKQIVTVFDSYLNLCCFKNHQFC